MRKLIIAFAALSLFACQTVNDPTQAPAPLSQTQIDDTALITADRAFDAALDGINLLIDRGIIVKGSPKAIAIAAAIRKVDAAFEVANHAVNAGNTTSYATALAEAKQAIDELRALLRN